MLLYMVRKVSQVRWVLSGDSYKQMPPVVFVSIPCAEAGASSCAVPAGAQLLQAAALK